MLAKGRHRTVSFTIKLAGLVALIAAFPFSICAAQSEPDALTPAMIEERIEAVETQAANDLSSQTDVIDLLSQAKAALAARSQRSQELLAYEATARNLGQLLAEVETRRNLLEQASDEAWNTASIADLETGLSMLLAERHSLEGQLSELSHESLELNGRAARIAEKIIIARTDVTRLLAATHLGQEKTDGLVEEARLLFAQARLLERQSAISDLQRELETLPARQSLAAERLALLEAEIAHNSQTIDSIRTRLGASALGRAEMAISDAEANMIVLALASPEISQMARGNLDLAIKVRDGINRRAVLERQILAYERDVKTLAQSADTVRLVLEAGRLSDDTAILLKTIRANLPDHSQINAQIFQSERQRGDIQLHLIVWLAEIRALDAASRVQSTFPETDSANGKASTQQAGSAVGIQTELLDFRRSRLEMLIDGARRESELISEYELFLSDLKQKSQELSGLLDRRLLWLRTSERVNGSWLDQIPNGIAWILSLSSWKNALKALFMGVLANPVAASLAGLVVLTLFGLRRRFLETLDRLGQDVGHVGRDSYWTTPVAMGVTLMLALPVPLTVGLSGWLIANSGLEAHAFTQSLKLTFGLLAPVLLVLYLFLDMCRPSGLFARHFNWTEKARARLHSNLIWFTRIEIGAIFLFGLSVFSSPPGLQYGIGIAAFVIGSLALAVLTFQFLRPYGGIVSLLGIGPTTTLLLKLVLPIAVFEPLFVGALPFFGFFETATLLQYKVLQSGALILGGSVLYGLALRMFMVGNRRFALRKAREKRARLGAARANATESEASGETFDLEKEDTNIDAEIISEQVRSVLRVATFGAVAVMLWVLWSSLIPALGIADDVSLWTRTVTSNGTELQEAVTLLDMMMVLFYLAGAIFVVRNVSGLLEVSIFEPFGLDAGSRYAVASITRYVIVAVAVLSGFSLLGARWSQLQWIIAALGVGLGFGLQEIVANFVSGLIILFERPIRVGDVVTIGDLRGTVRSIRIRATTITDFDSRQVILPNKTIITENVTNWTLDDDITRLLLKVGVAYGSNIEDVREIILDTVTAHPDVLDKPAPTVFFMAHGESALQFEVRLFVGKPARRLPTTHALNTAINAALQEHGIKIPFPQTDIHLTMSETASLPSTKA